MHSFNKRFFAEKSLHCFEKFVNTQLLKLSYLDIRHLACVPSLRRAPCNIHCSFNVCLVLGVLIVCLFVFVMWCLKKTKYRREWTCFIYPQWPLVEVSFQHFCIRSNARPCHCLSFFGFSPSLLKRIPGHFPAGSDSHRVGKSQVLSPSH